MNVLDRIGVINNEYPVIPLAAMAIMCKLTERQLEVFTKLVQGWNNETGKVVYVKAHDEDSKGTAIAITAMVKIGIIIPEPSNTLTPYMINPTLLLTTDVNGAAQEWDRLRRSRAYNQLV